jgi:hypothetical protein
MTVRNSPPPLEIDSASLGTCCSNCPRQAMTRETVIVDFRH